MRRDQSRLGSSDELRRTRLRALDACLTELEEAHERNELTISAGLAPRLAPHVPGLERGMALTDAINIVFAEQSRWLRQPADSRCGAEGPAPAATLAASTGARASGAIGSTELLDERGARELTVRIRAGAQELCMLLQQAHDGRAWEALGYPSWRRYVDRELGLSRSRAYELLDQAHVIRAVQHATGMADLPNISTNMAVKIKPRLSEVVEAIRRRTAEVPEERKGEAVAEVIRLERRRLDTAAGWRPKGLVATETSANGLDLPAHSCIAQLHRAIDVLARMPPVGEILELLPGEYDRTFAPLQTAQHWLNEFAAALRRHPKECERSANDGAEPTRVA